MSSEALDHDETISQFCGVTGADEERAKGLLEACSWNLELAINMHVDTDDGRGNKQPSISNFEAVRGGPSTSGASEVVDIDPPNDGVGIASEAPSNRIFRPPVSDRFGLGSNQPTEDRDYVRPPIPPVRQVLVHSPLEYSTETGPLTARRYNTRAGSGTTPDVYDAFRDFQAEAQWQEMAQEGETSDSTLNNASKRTLHDLYRPPYDMMFRGSWEGTRDAASLQNKWLLVNIQNKAEFACQCLNRDVWSVRAVKDIIKEHFLFWQVNHDTYDGSRYIQFYNVTSFPYVSIIDPRTGEQLKTWPKTIDHNSFCDSVIEFLTEHPSPDGSIEANTMKKLRVKEDKTPYDQSEEAQLEAAIKASLQETKCDKTIELDEDSENSSDVNKNNYRRPTPPPGMECKIALRFPDGSSTVQKFSTQEQLSAVKQFVQIEKEASNGAIIEFIAPPNKKLARDEMDKTLEDLGLCPASRLEVRYDH